MAACNLFEPLTVDDVCHHYFAAQVAEHPLDPYGFVVPWHQKPLPAWDVMVPPVNSYYWAPAIRWFGESELLWHLWYLPLQWLFCGALLALLRRWVRHGAGWLTAAIALGASVLPGVNFMLELPMLAFALGSLALLARAFERRAAGTAMLAGCLLGLALQTKYSALGFFAPWGLLALWQRRPRELLCGFVGVAAVAGGIEAMLAWSHGGGSYFLNNLSHTVPRDWNHVLRGMVVQYGVLGMPAALLALRGLGVAGARLAIVAGLYGIGYLAIAMAGTVGPQFAIDDGGFLLMTATTWGATLWFGVAAGLRSLRRGARRPGGSLRPAVGVDGLFFATWFVAEIASSLAMSPFPAARRVLMMTVVATCGAGWWVTRRRGVRGAVRSVAVAAVLTGIGYQALDCLDGACWRTAARVAADWAHRQAPTAKCFFTGGWGFEFYAPVAGLTPLLRGQSEVCAGDLVAVGSIDGVEPPWFEPTDLLEPLAELTFGVDGCPLSLQLGYYSGRRPIDCQVGPRYVVRMLRARADFHCRDLALRPTYPFNR